MIDFEIKDMTCGHCRAAIVRAIHGVDDAAQVTVDMERQHVHIGTKVAGWHRFSTAITVAGYTPVRIGAGEESFAAPQAGCSCAGTGAGCGMRLTDVGAKAAARGRPVPPSTVSAQSGPGCCSSSGATCHS